MVRTKKPGEEVKKYMVTLRVTEGERETLRRGADLANRDVSDWVRLLAIEAAKKLIDKETKRPTRPK